MKREFSADTEPKATNDGSMVSCDQEVSHNVLILVGCEVWAAYSFLLNAMENFFRLYGDFLETFLSGSVWSQVGN